MPAVTRVYTVQLAAKMLDRDQDLIWSLSDQMRYSTGTRLFSART